MSPFTTNEQQDPEPLSAQWQHLHDGYAELTQEKTLEVLEAYLEQYVLLKEVCAAHAFALDDAQLSVQLMKDLRGLNVMIFMTSTAEKKVRQLAGLYRTVLAHFSLSTEDRAYLNGEMRSCAKALTLVKKAFFRGPLLHHSDETFEAIAQWEKEYSDFCHHSKPTTVEMLRCVAHYFWYKEKLKAVGLYYDDPRFQEQMVKYIDKAATKCWLSVLPVLLRMARKEDFWRLIRMKLIYEIATLTFPLSQTQQWQYLNSAEALARMQEQLCRINAQKAMVMARLKKFFRIKRD
ncbi:MAG: hypothetical protein SOR95_02200 [Sutterella sp.]|nr:hypothetical protein [Sutterella sp.]